MKVKLVPKRVTVGANGRPQIKLCVHEKSRTGTGFEPKRYIMTMNWPRDLKHLSLDLEEVTLHFK